jgi:hypothetical protein
MYRIIGQSPRRLAPAGTTGTMPTTDPVGWVRVFEDDYLYTFAEGDITPNGSGDLVSGPAAATVGATHTFYPDTWNSTHGTKVYPKTVGEPGYPGNWPPIVAKYYPSKTISFGDSCARIRMHSELVSGVQTFMGAVMKPKVGPTYMWGPYGRWRFRMRVVDVVVDDIDRSATGDFTTGSDSYHHIVPLTIDSNNWPSGGELDWPEGSSNRRIKGFYHPAAPTNESWPIDVPGAPVSFYDWHEYEYIWEPGRIRFLLDGVVCKDTTDRVPAIPHAWVFQFEADWRQPQMTATSTVEIDWTVFWEMA